jgi:hypothetical protein
MQFVLSKPELSGEVIPHSGVGGDNRLTEVFVQQLVYQIIFGQALVPAGADQGERMFFAPQ